MSDRMDPNAREARVTTTVEEPLQTTTTTYAGSRAGSRAGARVVHDDPAHEPTLGELFVELSDDFSHLVRQEMALAKAEMRENLDRGRQGAILLAIGGVLAYSGLLVLLAAIVIVVGNLIDSYWLAAFGVAAVVIVIGLMMIFSGKGKLEKMNLIPQKTIHSIERDAKMAKEKLT